MKAAAPMSLHVLRIGLEALSTRLVSPEFAAIGGTGRRVKLGAQLERRRGEDTVFILVSRDWVRKASQVATVLGQRVQRRRQLTLTGPVQVDPVTNLAKIVDPPLVNATAPFRRGRPGVLQTQREGGTDCQDDADTTRGRPGPARHGCSSCSSRRRSDR